MAGGAGEDTDGGSISTPQVLEQLPQYAEQYAPGLQNVANTFRDELLKLAASRANEVTRSDPSRPEVSFPFPTLEGLREGQ